jgi:chlorite dismutase
VTDPAGTPFTLWAVWRRESSATVLPAYAVAVENLGVTIRGIYDVSGMRAGADLMVWFVGVTPEALQAAVRAFRKSSTGLALTWSAMGVHRPAEFSREHAPSFMKDLAPKTWVTVYPFVRSYDWYLLPEDERRAMLADHGRKGSEYSSVQANTVASFALGDYEWILALEADDLVDLVDLMRHLRNTEARRHVREEVPFFTGRRIEFHEIGEVLA